MSIESFAAQPVARINGIALNSAGEALSPEELRQRACTELLRQAAQSAGLLAASKRIPITHAIVIAVGRLGRGSLIRRESPSTDPRDWPWCRCKVTWLPSVGIPWTGADWNEACR